MTVNIYTQKCTNNLSLESLEKYDDALVDISIAQLDFDAVSFSRLYRKRTPKVPLLHLKLKTLYSPKNEYWNIKTYT